MEYGKELRVEKTTIPGLLLVDLTVHGDTRGWFKENWQRVKMCGIGVPDHRWVQNNVSYNAERGVVRGIHAEPWDKWISVAVGSVFGAWVDLRMGSDTYGEVFTAVLDPGKAIYVPRGVGNSFQCLEDGTAYTYLVDAHWAAELKPSYTFVNVADPELAIPWPIPLSECELSEADKSHPMLSDVTPMLPKRTLVTGANGQLGKAMRTEADARGFTTFDYTDIDEFDFSNPDDYAKIDWSLYGTVINCGAYTAVDAAETSEGRVVAWRANAFGPAQLARVCAEHGITLVHVSSDYVFDGTSECHEESEGYGPLGVYGQTKAAGDLAVEQCPAHYIVRSSWVIGEGKNFVKTMAALSDRVANPNDALSRVTVVDDQVGRLTFTDDMARGILWLLGYRTDSVAPSEPAPYGTYNLTGSGRSVSWHEVAKLVFELRNGNGDSVVAVSTDDYYASAQGPIAPRPHYSTLALKKLQMAGFTPADWENKLKDYMSTLPSREG